MIGILGGTFDPIHFGHLRPALEISEKFELEQLRFIPSATPPHRWKPVASAAHRLNMVKLAVQEIPEFVVDDREYQRQGSSYTVDTLQSIHDDSQKPDSILMLLGLDAFQSFTQWHEWERILTLAHIVVSTRPGYKLPQRSAKKKADSWMQGRIVDSMSELKAAQAGCIFFCEVTQLDISATSIRNMLQHGKSSRFLMPEQVVNYIHQNTLYENRI